MPSALAGAKDLPEEIFASDGLLEAAAGCPCFTAQWQLEALFPVCFSLRLKYITTIDFGQLVTEVESVSPIALVFRFGSELRGRS